MIPGILSLTIKIIYLNTRVRKLKIVSQKCNLTYTVTEHSYLTFADLLYKKQKKMRSGFHRNLVYSFLFDSFHLQPAF